MERRKVMCAYHCVSPDQPVGAHHVAASVGSLFHFKLKVHVCLWHIASCTMLALNGRYRTNSGQTAALTLNRYAAIDPTATLAAALSMDLGQQNR
jgi:hypothetical protein